MESLLRDGRGVYNISRVARSVSVPVDLVVVSGDPGQANIVNVYSAASEIWARKDPKILPTSTYVLGDDYCLMYLIQQRRKADTSNEHTRVLHHELEWRYNYNSSGEELLIFGSTPDAIRADVKNDLNEVRRRRDILANGAVAWNVC